MKICCDFLPNEYKAVRRNLKLIVVAGVSLVLTGLIISYTMWSYGREKTEVDGQVRTQESAISVLEGQINALNYDQEKIGLLIQRFRFIQQAMGSEDYPYLEFFQALEEAVPVNEDSGLRRVAIKSLKMGAGNTWQIQGEANHWDDILAFENGLNSSIFERPVEQNDGSIRRIKKKNFNQVRVFKVDTATTGNGVTFDLQFDFIRG